MISELLCGALNPLQNPILCHNPYSDAYPEGVWVMTESTVLVLIPNKWNDAKIPGSLRVVAGGSA